MGHNVGKECDYFSNNKSYFFLLNFYLIFTNFRLVLFIIVLIIKKTCSILFFIIFFYGLTFYQVLFSKWEIFKFLSFVKRRVTMGATRTFNFWKQYLRSFLLKIKEFNKTFILIKLKLRGPYFKVPSFSSIDCRGPGISGPGFLCPGLRILAMP